MDITLQILSKFVDVYSCSKGMKQSVQSHKGPAYVDKMLAAPVGVHFSQGRIFSVLFAESGNLGQKSIIRKIEFFSI